MDTLASNLAKFLKNYREEKGYTQQELAEVLGVSRATVARWEGKNPQGIGLPELESMAAQLKTRVANLLGIVEDDGLGIPTRDSLLDNIRDAVRIACAQEIKLSQVLHEITGVNLSKVPSVVILGIYAIYEADYLPAQHNLLNLIEAASARNDLVKRCIQLVSEKRNPFKMFG